MGYFDDEKNVKGYIEMVERYDGSELIDVLLKHLGKGSSLLELGMGPGKDLDILAENYKVTGSDLSQVFIEIYRKDHPEADVMLLDAVKVDTDRKFDCIYSNKVLHHLKREELKESFRNQLAGLNEGGLLFHTFWRGDKEEMMHDLRFVYYNAKTIMEAVGEGYILVEMTSYTEAEDNDSFHLILKKA
jgi:cyclopropane fatty-acyl-phospholipid synthase-like methyltransferase